jgi:hypothetical protein
VLQVHPNRLQVVNVLCVIDRDFNRSSVRQETEMVRRLVVRESHRHVAVLLNIGLMSRLLFVHRAGLHVLCSESQSKEQGNHQYRSHRRFLRNFVGLGIFFHPSVNEWSK